MTLPIALTFMIAAAFSFAADALTLPRSGWRRAPRAYALHVISVVFISSLLLALTRRPHFSAFVALALVALLSAVSNAKYASLREPFVFTDLSLFSQLFAHPRLYLPFLSMRTAIAIAAGVALVACGFLLDLVAPANVAFAAAVVTVLSLALGYVLAARLPLTLEPLDDQRRHGFFAVFVAYLLNGLRRATFVQFEHALAASPFARASEPASRPDVIVIQSESFFDARELGGSINPSILANFEVAQRDSAAYGALDVPAWGANTMRSEFALLSGLSSAALGYARFYPYAFMRRAGPSLARWFLSAGYATLAIHPYYADFFGRKRVFPRLGFDRFVDIHAFAKAPRIGPYVADSAVAERIIMELESSRTRPSFIFAMTMENHGPLHLERIEAGEAERYHTLGEDLAWRDLTAYLRHLANADAMLGRLLEYARTRRRDTVLCFYGDHVPALPHIFDRLGNVPDRSHYFIWRNFGDRSAAKHDLPVERLGTAVLQAMETASRSDAPIGLSERTEKI
ncbi:LTA synthase family protein [Paraburkholderia hospita]|uniref:LTA synthase family protein n=1 Tax=Paraburkholderia hospita TaxID=169430 RepID=UPI0002716072|nr:LTA synthase family protein [Paraburkholderia hospita]EUC14753.1 sulfatase [Burkholderia sp. BT03]SKC93993.1 Phosphoglycerol transferase MdoB [Paraburkholderia hospita]